jgi:hypothetical protein
MHCQAASGTVPYSACAADEAKGALTQVPSTMLLVNSDCPDASLGCMGGCFEATEHLLQDCLLGAPLPSVVAGMLIPVEKRLWLHGKSCKSLGFDQQDELSVNGDPCYGGNSSLIRFYMNYDYGTFRELTSGFCPPQDCDAWVAAHPQCCDGPCEPYPERPEVTCSPELVV